ncbi:kinase-like protein, partial [Athelia psychrophila]
ALVKLSELSQRYSECLVLEDIIIPKDPVQCGSFGEVFKGDMAGCAIAVKVLKVYQKSNIDKILKSFSHEAVIWRQLSHPNVLPFYGVFADCPKLCLVSPWMQNGNLSDFLAEIAPEIDCVPLALDVAKGLEYLHSQNVLHADLKCGNVLVSDARRACLADFGLSVVQDTNSVRITGTSTIGAGGTLAWTAPELLFDDTKRPDEACDVYSFSMVCYEASSNRTMHSICKSGPQVVIATSQGLRPERPVDPRSHRRGLTDDIWDIIAVCWNQQPEARLTVGQAVQRLSTLPNRPPDNRPVDDDPPNSRVMYRQAHRPFSILKMIPERESTGTPCVPGSMSQMFGLANMWDSEG